MGDSESYLFLREVPQNSFVIKSLEFQEPFYMHCLQCEVHWPPEARSPIQCFCLRISIRLCFLRAPAPSLSYASN